HVDGCFELARWQDVIARVAALRAPPAQIVERRPLPFAPKRVTVDGAELRDPDAGAALITALRAPARVVPLPAGPPHGQIVADDLALDLYDRVLARHGEPVALAPDDWATIARPASAYRDAQRWIEEP